MFNNMETARRIRQARIDKNMTQMNLADAMGVSYQAVSNWERGNSLPDISKLGELCKVLEMNLGTLLGIEESSPAAKAVKEEPLTVEELKEVAPMLPPSAVKEQVEQERKKKKLDLSALADIAPFLDEEYLDSLVEEADLSDLEGLDEIAPFLSQKTLNSLVDRADLSCTDALEDVLCFLDSEAVDRFLLRCLDAGKMDAIEEAAVFASEKGLDALVDAYIAKGRTEDLEDIYPFLGKQSLRKLAKHMMESRDMDGLGEIAVFL